MRGKFKPTIPQRSRHSSHAESASSDSCTASNELGDSSEEPERPGNDTTRSTSSVTATSLATESQPSQARGRKRPVPNLSVAAAKRTKEATGQATKERYHPGESVDSEISQTSAVSGAISVDKPVATESEEVVEAVTKSKDEERSRCRKKSMSKCKEMPSDRTNLKMCDLIYHNPKTNPMKKTSSDTGRKKTNSKATKEHVEPQPEPQTRQKVNDQIEDNDDNDDDVIAPRVKVGPDGSIIIDQDSLVIQPTRAQLADLPSNSDIHEDEGPLITSGSFRKHSSTKAWSKEETEKLYEALSKVGTDFSLMVGMFPGRSRKQIKAKFKREEKCSCAHINEAINKSIPLQESTFESLIGSSKSVPTQQADSDK